MRNLSKSVYLLLFLLFGSALPAAANGPCGSPLDFSGTYTQSCAGNPWLVIHAALDIEGHKDKVDHKFRLYCNRRDPGFQEELRRFHETVERTCVALGGSNCQQLAQGFADGVAGLNDAILSGLPRKVEVNVWWDQLPWIPFGPHRHRAQFTDVFRDGNARQANYVLNNTCEERGEIGALGLAFPLGGGNRDGFCFISLAAAAEGRIDPRSFEIRRDVTLDGSLTCLGRGGAINAGVTFKVSLVGKRY